MVAPTPSEWFAAVRRTPCSPSKSGTTIRVRVIASKSAKTVPSPGSASRGSTTVIDRPRSASDHGSPSTDCHALMTASRSRSRIVVKNAAVLGTDYPCPTLCEQLKTSGNRRGSGIRDLITLFHRSPAPNWASELVFCEGTTRTPESGHVTTKRGQPTARPSGHAATVPEEPSLTREGPQPCAPDGRPSLPMSSTPPTASFMNWPKGCWPEHLPSMSWTV